MQHSYLYSTFNRHTRNIIVKQKQCYVPILALSHILIRAAMQNQRIWQVSYENDALPNARKYYTVLKLVLLNAIGFSKFPDVNSSISSVLKLLEIITCAPKSRTVIYTSILIGHIQLPNLIVKYLQMISS